MRVQQSIRSVWTVESGAFEHGCDDLTYILTSQTCAILKYIC